MSPKRNNLDRSDSLYLRQHSENPIHWQEWGPDIPRIASELQMPLFVSVGYSSCHWCHVMAAEAFSDRETAKFLNDHFICVKVDREERPDIDHYLMEFLVKRTGNGGWPLNVFLTPELVPVHGLTYAPSEPKWGMPTLLDIAKRVNSSLASGHELPDFVPESRMPTIPENPNLLKRLFDAEHGGFGMSHKFPPHSTLLYMLYEYHASKNPSMETMAVRTLDAMRLGGLNDHLQGGIFRYCVDREWTVPHFEKMLYDQAMALWVFSLAYGVLGRDADRAMAMKIKNCLDASFLRDGLYLNSLDADTEHSEGATYLWDHEDLENLLGPADLARLSEAYHISPKGNFEGRIHLVRRNDIPLADIESRLLEIRRGRAQPGADMKFLSGINALTVCGLVQASRFLGQPGLLEQASNTMRKVMDTFWSDGKFFRSMSNGNVKRNSFLFDASAALLAMTMLAENEPAWSGPMQAMADHVDGFRDGNLWLESRADDFHPVPASWHDQPIPSGISLAELGISRFRMMSGESSTPMEFGIPHQSDFHNVAAMLSHGRCPYLKPIYAGADKS
jgi:hypothetical protein